MENIDNILSIKNLTHKYGDNHVLNNLNLNVEKGKIYGLLGRNGAGKTTLIKIILGLIKTKNGKILFNNKVMQFNPNFLNNFGTIIEFPGFYPHLTAKENLMVFSYLYDNKYLSNIKNTLQLVGLENLKNKKVFQFSLGMKQRLGLARALIHNPQLLILDEPTNGLDPCGLKDMRNLFKTLSKNYGKTIFISSHILTEIEQVVDNIGILKDGYIIEELSIQNLIEKNQIGLKIITNDIKKTKYLIDKKTTFESIILDKNSCLVKNCTSNSDINKINLLLLKNSIEIYCLSVEKRSLEEYFIEKTN